MPRLDGSALGAGRSDARSVGVPRAARSLVVGVRRHWLIGCAVAYSLVCAFISGGILGVVGWVAFLAAVVVGVRAAVARLRRGYARINDDPHTYGLTDRRNAHRDGPGDDHDADHGPGDDRATAHHRSAALAWYLEHADRGAALGLGSGADRGPDGACLAAADGDGGARPFPVVTPQPSSARSGVPRFWPGGDSSWT